jgi:hypothetical protein
MKKCAIKLVAFNGGHLGDCEGGIRDPNDARQRDPTTLDNVTQCELQWYENNYKALNLITTDLCRNVYDRVSHLKTAYDVWLKLGNTYEGSSEIKSSRKDTYNS